ncbi:MAG: AMP-binding protein [Candidatus Cloacimonetes bacterium]|nr:AMP-binding protein [Candidatus Cloacimonadota bacterium]
MLQLHQRFIQSAKRFPKRIAVYDKATMTDYSYSRMLIASFILKEHIGKIKGKYIGVLLPTGVGAMLTILGTLMKGKIPVMINYATGAIENCRYAREKCQFKTIITSKKLFGQAESGADRSHDLCGRHPGQSQSQRKTPGCALIQAAFFHPEDMVHHGDLSEISVILFTSGSEKEPKAVQLSHRNILHNVNAFPTMIELNENDVFASILPMFHVFGLTVDFWLPALIGASMVTYPNPLEYKTVSDYVREYKVTFIAATPAFFYGYLQKSRPGDFASVKIAIAGADKLPDKVYEGFQKKHGITMYEGYGTTETSPVISTTIPEITSPVASVVPSPILRCASWTFTRIKSLAPIKKGRYWSKVTWSWKAICTIWKKLHSESVMVGMTPATSA